MLEDILKKLPARAGELFREIRFPVSVSPGSFLHLCGEEWSSVLSEVLTGL